jgi:hypothetical protein
VVGESSNGKTGGAKMRKFLFALVLGLLPVAALADGFSFSFGHGHSHHVYTRPVVVVEERPVVVVETVPSYSFYGPSVVYTTPGYFCGFRTEYYRTHGHFRPAPLPWHGGRYYPVPVHAPRPAHRGLSRGHR